MQGNRFSVTLETNDSDLRIAFSLVLYHFLSVKTMIFLSRCVAIPIRIIHFEFASQHNPKRKYVIFLYGYLEMTYSDTGIRVGILCMKLVALGDANHS